LGERRFLHTVPCQQFLIKQKIDQVAAFLSEAQQFSDGQGNVDYRAFADMMMMN
jgi:pyrimidine deaminase RibD-like protein